MEFQVRRLERPTSASRLGNAERRLSVMLPGCRIVVEGGAAQRVDEQLCPAGRSGVTFSEGAAGSAARGRPLQPRGRERSLEGFVHVHLAWLYVLHGHLKGDGVDYRHRQPESRRFTGVDPQWRSPRRSASGDDRRSARVPAQAAVGDRLRGAAKRPAST
jgi:hypothetical protein